ncbi:hypothetical protein NLJ89_g2641 [Agrocybe chaxingu]|uniref:Alpha/beta hydrolase fold-3 domain-containing protein n=1 Tax=Agrocybe chaxingu TaxID=84603 RepID=A0A9W8MXI2_9AGAR|nr:hypothetical protein NLJ89_g2641 [Agrocybe chaxingu]
MLANSLTREVSLKVGPVMLEVLVRHFFDRLRKDAERRNDSGARLKEDDVLYDEAFNIVKAFLHASTFHTVEELQGFSNTRTPSPPWVHVIRTVVPMPCCEEAATHLIKALGGEEAARRLVGGTKWWQVRGINGVDAQWITAKKDWQEAKRRHKMQKERKKDGLPVPPVPPSSAVPSADAPTQDEGVYNKDMDAMRCILYLHGGGYYFGSVDQERYSIQRHARKINGRVFAINYRLAPQYPFPCGLQDALAAYLFLIRPPAGADHIAVKPEHIVVAGDSAGGGLSLSLLQVIRDSGLPLPAGGVLISPWCDLTHSFPSVHINTKTDVIPESGLSFHKPSILWPPPSPEVSTRVHASLRFRIRQAFKMEDSKIFSQLSTVISDHNTPHLPELDTPIPDMAPVDPEKVVVHTETGEVLEANEQLHFYTVNSLLAHPLISPVTSYLGGLPPLLFIAGDKEVLKDEIVYTAHKAAYPEKYPVTEDARQLYPSLVGIEERHPKPTSVHLQVYDGTPHILPVLFSFTTPAKFCFRGIASFIKFITEMTPLPIPMTKSGRSTPTVQRTPSLSRRSSLFAGFSKSRLEAAAPPSPVTATPTSEPIITVTESPPTPVEAEPHVSLGRRPSLRRQLSARLARAGSVLRRTPSPGPSIQEEPASSAPAQTPAIIPEAKFEPEKIDEKEKDDQTRQTSIGSSDVGGPRFQTASLPPEEPVGEREAGELVVYADINNRSSWDCRMIRERISTAGIIQPLEPESELDAFQLPQDRIGKLSEMTMKRYLRDRALFDKKFAHTTKTIEKHRRHNLERAKEDTIKRLSILRATITRDGKAAANGSSKKEIKENVVTSPGWAWAWALDDSESPPPSSIVSRRDTEEARKLAAVADQAIVGEDQTFSGNNLWSVVINFLTATPGKDSHILHKSRNGSEVEVNGDAASLSVEERPKLQKRKSIFGHHLWPRTEQEAKV